VGLQRELPDLRARIAQRYERQMAAGFLDEVRRLRDEPRGISRTARKALGYKELLDHLDGASTLDGAVDVAVRRTRRFARRQIAWFRRDPRLTWLDAAPGTAGDELVAALRAAV
jgi:tRNA dimethylallyltransferase